MVFLGGKKKGWSYSVLQVTVMAGKRFDTQGDRRSSWSGEMLNVFYSTLKVDGGWKWSRRVFSFVNIYVIAECFPYYCAWRTVGCIDTSKGGKIPRQWMQAMQWNEMRKRNEKKIPYIHSFIEWATLTGHAGVSLGPFIPHLFYPCRC